MSAMPQIFKSDSVVQPTESLAVVQPDSKWLDAVTHLSMFSGRSIPDTRQAFEGLLRQEKDPDYRAVLFAGVARCLNSQMRLKEGGELLGHAWKLLSEDASEHKAFVLLEMARFLLLIGNRDSATMLLDQASSMVNSEYLKRQLLYYKLALRAAEGQDVIKELEHSAQWFIDRGQKATAVSHLRMIAQLECAAGNEDQAELVYERGIALSNESHLRFCKALMLNDMGLMYYEQKKKEEAFARLEQALALAEFPYSRIDSLDLIGKCLQLEGQYAEAASHFTEAQNTAAEYGTMIIVPSLCLHLGQCHEALEQQQLARHFYTRAYQSTMELLDNGFPATESRLGAIREFVRYCAQNTAVELEEPTEADDFSFAMDRSLKEIRTIFQMALLDTQIDLHSTQKEAVEHLGIAQRSISNVRQRHRGFGDPAAPHVVTQFIRLNTDLNWKEINQKFDDTLLAWLYDRYDRNRKLMSDKLGLSYPHLSALISRAVKNKSGKTSERSTDVQKR